MVTEGQDEIENGLKIAEIKVGTGIKSRDGQFTGVVTFNEVASGGDISIRWVRLNGRETGFTDGLKYNSTVWKDGQFLACEELNEVIVPAVPLRLPNDHTDPVEQIPVSYPVIDESKRERGLLLWLLDKMRGRR